MTARAAIATPRAPKPQSARLEARISHDLHGAVKRAAEIQGLLMRIEAASTSVAAGQDNFSNQANGWWRDLQSLQQGMSSLTNELNSLKNEIRQQRPPENF